MTHAVRHWSGSEGPALIGVVHLEPLPGAPRSSLPVDSIVEAAVRDAVAWKEGGADAVLVENFGDDPFFPGSVPPETIASMTAAARAVRAETGLPLGVNVLRNDGLAALAVAHASGGSFIRVNVLTHASLTDQGVIEGIAHDLLRTRRALGSDVVILADLLVKHSVPLAPLDPVCALRDMVERGGAGGIVLTGNATGSPLDMDLPARLAAEVPSVPLFVGSGTTPDNVGEYLPHVRGFLVGTWCKSGGRVDRSKVEIVAARIHRKTT